MKKINLLGYLTMAFFLTIMSCTSEEGVMELNESNQKSFTTDSEICGDAKVVSLIAGQHIDAGTVTVSNDETNLYVTYNATGDWSITETHLYVGVESGIPLTKSGNPRFGHFPYHGNSEAPFVIPLADLDDNFVVVAHAVVDKITNGQSVQNETAFGCGDKEFPGKRWGCYFDYEKEDCEKDDCIDVFARKYEDRYVTCVDFPVNGKTLAGWSSWFPYSILFDSQERELDIYKSTDNCDISGAAYIGRVSLIKASNDTTLNVSHLIFNIEYGGDNPGSINNYGISEYKLYIGPEENPYNTDGSLKPSITESNFYTQKFDPTIKRSDEIMVTWDGDTNPDTKVYLISYIKACKL